MSAQMNARRARAKALRKASKEGKKHKLTETAAATVFKIPNADATATSSSSGSGDSSPDGETAAKKAKKAAPATGFGHQKEAKAKVAKTIQDDPTKSEVYKRLFSSHHTALNQPKGNWVTFDPRYN